MSEEVLIHFPPAGSFGGKNPSELYRKISGALADRVEAAYAFGSFARGDGGFDSDIDLILIKQTGERFPRRAFEFEDLLGIYPDMDILVYTPEEFSSLTDHPTRGFWKDVVRDLRRIL